MEHMFIAKNSIQKSLLFLISLLIWQFFYPALMSNDSIIQYGEALNFSFDDWHPPLMAIILAAALKLGGIGLLTLIQSLAALFGIRLTVLLSTAFFSERSASQPVIRLAAFVITILFLVPFLTPYMFFANAFWKDAWIAVLLLWTTSYFLWLVLNLEPLGKKRFILHITLLSGVSASMVSVRYNALSVIIIICLMTAVLSRIKFGAKGFLAFGLPPLFVILFNFSTNFFLPVLPAYPGNQVLAGDLTTMLKLYPEIESEYPMTARHKNSPVVFGVIERRMWDQSTDGVPCPYLDRNACNHEMPLGCYGIPENTLDIDGLNCYAPFGSDNKALKDEYRKAIINHPLRLAAAKIFLFAQMLRPLEWREAKYPTEIAENPYGLKSNQRFASVRKRLYELSSGLGNSWGFIWISNIQLLWLVLNVSVAIFCAVRFFTKRDRKYIFALLIFLMPLSYYFSYLLAATGPDYRFMYPATLLTQVFFVSLLTTQLLKLSLKFRRSGNSVKRITQSFRYKI